MTKKKMLAGVSVAAIAVSLLSGPTHVDGREYDPGYGVNPPHTQDLRGYYRDLYRCDPFEDYDCNHRGSPFDNYPEYYEEAPQPWPEHEDWERYQ